MQDTKKWFEANYLDGDEIQGGQMLSSEECLDAVHSAQTRLLEGIVKMAESRIESLKNMEKLSQNEKDKAFFNGQAFALSDIISKLREQDVDGINSN